MDISILMQSGAQLFQSKLDTDGDGQIEISDLVPALSALFGNEQGEFDLSSITSKMSAGGLMEMAQSWMGDGENQPVSGEQITEMLGADKVSAFADQLGISKESALGGLQEAVPGIIDQASSGGLMDMAGSVLGQVTDSAQSSGGGIMGMLTGMIGKLFGR